jgi:hypothetical protein
LVESSIHQDFTGGLISGGIVLYQGVKKDMKSNRLFVIYWRVLALLIAISLLAACGGQAGAPTELPGTGGTETAAGTVEATLPAGGGTQTPGASQGLDYIAPSSEDCQKLAADVGATLAAEPEAVAVEETAPFTDTLTQETGVGCQVTVTGTGADFPDYESFVDIAAALGVVLQSTGWDPDPAYVADSPTGTAFAVRRDNELALVNVDWEPAPEANCPQDRPISECEVTPEQMNYTIRVNYGVRPQ